MLSKSKRRKPGKSELTRQRFLRAAEAVFRKHGFDATTVREVSRRAGANLGTLQHYWGSKRALFRDLFAKRFTPMRDQYLRQLLDLEVHLAPAERPAVEDILRVFVNITFQPRVATKGGSPPETARSLRARRELFGRALMDPSRVVVVEMNRLFDQPLGVLVRLLARARPDLDSRELRWRVTCVAGCNLVAMLHEERMPHFLDDSPGIPDDLAADWVLRFLLGGFTAPPTARP